MTAQQANTQTPRGILSNRSGRSIQPSAAARKESVKVNDAKRQDRNFLNLDGLQEDGGP
eukprot:CAMPEP_0170490446 /NCGR_PEP_ID=MMETSP0208-20121228/8627_1 /TAXON_ID=197538 /ORGANISM="Strombidium inclinatum, Strain S3" /LENGTH=58 /DNA_ID=CAMNT_0010765817 /DNA_START=519 /DNA_END=695 /DNA_ORIENTATION=-